MALATITGGWYYKLATPLVLNWHHVFNANVDKLYRDHLKFAELRNVDTTGLQDGDALEWDTTTSKWIVRRTY
jgi:hypothetical protein